ncbi:DUF5668 domain-containing protein [Chitinibacter sp. FCG-7]|uniref:DUF5668 domain-containing protein n=1 Tax=Chitinibacter mangrovi TaxID=3153927 RepID=A0AAU7FBA5_9NEIS
MRHSIILLLIGAVFLGVNLGWWPGVMNLLATWWPLILIAVGISGLIRHKENRTCRHPHHQGEQQ